MSSTSSAAPDAEQTTVNGDQQPQGATPPLLPAFLITGLLLAAIIFIIIWRHLIERRNARREIEDPTWPAEVIGVGNDGSPWPKGPTPKLWELQFSNRNAHTTWSDVMPLSATMLRAPPKPCRPRYLVPSDRHISFFERTFGGDRRPPRPPLSLLEGSLVSPAEEKEEEEDGIVDRLQVAVLISLPHPRYTRQDLPPSEVNSSVPQLPPEETLDPPSPSKGKKRSLEVPSDKKSLIHELDDVDGPLEVAFGTIVAPFTED